MDSETPVLEVLAAGAGMTIQDLGRSGWKRFGIPPGGAMDLESARQANLLVGNKAGAPVVELLFTGAKFLVLSSSELAIAGAEVECEWPTWRNFHVEPGSEISFGPLRAGVWSYLAVRGGFAAPRWFGSASANPRAGFGEPVQPGARLSCEKRLPAEEISSRFVPELVREEYGQTPVLRVWPGPEWDGFTEEARREFLGQTWRVSSQSDRAGYRLEGIALESRLRMPSAPVVVGAIQIPPNGQPIVLLRDGPTVGGYPRLAILDASRVSRFTQCAPGTCVRFALA
ncbi:MAG TPA: biotin-dependent carboxyltransferase family protein [Terrimicrobium sp.]